MMRLAFYIFAGSCEGALIGGAVAALVEAVMKWGGL